MSEVEIADKGRRFLIHRTMQMCPPHMMLRELIMNAIEAAVRVARKEIRIGSCLIDGVPKLRIWNTGRGMNATELREACNISSSIGKTQALDGNFGIGAKAAALQSNRRGMRYRSCKDGKVSEVLLGVVQAEDGPRYMRRDNAVANTGTPHNDVLDVTAEIAEDERKEDWTEVVLCGNRREQNTVEDPYDGNPEVNKSRWIANAIYERFHRLPAGVKVILEKSVQSKDKEKDRTLVDYVSHMETIGKKHPEDVRCEVVSPQGESVAEFPGLEIRYYYDGPMKGKDARPRSYSGNIASSTTFCAVGYKNELYDFRTRRKWQVIAPKMGVPFGSRYVTILLELPDDASVRTDDHRTKLRRKSRGGEVLDVEDFASVIRENMPGWLKEKISAHSQHSTSFEDVSRQLSQFLREVEAQLRSLAQSRSGSTRVRLGTEEPGESPTPVYGPGPDPAPGLTGGGGKAPVPGDGPGLNPGRDTQRHASRGSEDLVQTPLGEETLARLQSQKATPPTFHMLDNLVDHPDLEGFAAKYEEETNEMFINMGYAAFLAAREALESDYAGDAESIGEEEFRMYIRDCVSEVSQLNLGKYVILAQAKKRMGWNPEAIKRAMSPESLSITADGITADKSHLGNLKKKISNHFQKPAP